MKQDSSSSVNVRMPGVRVKGNGSPSKAEGQARAITQGVEHAVRDFAESGRHTGHVHIDRLNVKLTTGASDRQIAESIRRALKESLQSPGGRNGSP